MKSWYVVHTKPQQEMLTHQNLGDQGFEAYLPRFIKNRSHARKIERVQIPIFPRYVFVAFDLESTQWRAINSTRGALGLVSLGQHPARVPAKIIEALKARETSEGIVNAEMLNLYNEGDTVYITNGPFKGHEATLAQLSGDERAQLLISFMQREMHISVSLHDLEAA